MPIEDFLVWLSSITQSQTKKACTVGVADVVVNRLSSAEHRSPATRFEYIPEESVGRANPAEMRSDFDKLAAMRVELARSDLNFVPRCHSGFKHRLTGFLLRHL